MVTRPTVLWWLRPANRAFFETVLGLLNDPVTRAAPSPAYPESRIDRPRSTTATNPVSDHLYEREYADA